MGYKVLVTDEIDRIAVKILQDICEVDYQPVLTLNVDEPVSAAVLIRLQNIEGIYDAQYVNLNAK
ncbi:MAG: hypothetical protein ACHQ0Y_12190 [Thermodesulfovibrionales bacterium]